MLLHFLGGFEGIVLTFDFICAFFKHEKHYFAMTFSFAPCFDTNSIKTSKEKLLKKGLLAKEQEKILKTEKGSGKINESF